MKRLIAISLFVLIPFIGLSQFLESRTLAKTSFAPGGGSYMKDYYYLDFDNDGIIDVLSNYPKSFYKGLGDGKFERLPLNIPSYQFNP